MSDSSSDVVVSIAEAARRLSVTPDVVCKHINQGQLQTRRVENAKGIHVVLPDALDASLEPGPEAARNGHTHGSVPVELEIAIAALREALAHQEANKVAALRDAVTVLRGQLAIKDEQLAERDRQIAFLVSRSLTRRLRTLLFGPESSRAA